MTAEPQKLWMEQLENALEFTESIPLWGMPPSFPWETFSRELSDFFGITPLHISHYSTKWETASNLLEGYGKEPALEHFTLTPLPIHLTFVMSAPHKQQLVSMLLTEDGKKFSDTTLVDGFFQFIFLKVMERFNQMNIYGNLSATLIDNPNWDDEDAFCIDVKILVGKQTLFGRLIVPNSSHHSFKTHFSMEKPPIFSDPKLGTIPLNLQVQIGHTKILPSEWKKVHVGDFILFDRCTYDPSTKKGTALLVLGNIPLFELRIKDDEIKILEYAFYQEDKSMTPKDFSEEPPFEELSSSNEEPEPLWSPKTEEEHLQAAQKIPLAITIEVGRVHMPLEKLTQLKPGNLLHLNLPADHGVYLTVEGKRIARGELVKLGEALGVKILKIGE